jgi:SNF2 family DNA or RNA helicase
MQTPTQNRISMALERTAPTGLIRTKPVVFESSTFQVLPAEPLFTPADWQTEDLDHIADKPWSANWSEMGCYKTSTALWLIGRKLKDIENPRVLVVSSKTGKGAWFRDTPKVLAGWTVINLLSTGKSELSFLGKFLPHRKMWMFPKKRHVPTIVVAHYHCFTNKAIARQLIEAEEWDMVILDEAHRIKEKNTQWTRNLKALVNGDENRKPIEFRHIMTGTGFINRPDEIWSLLHFLSRQTFGSYKAFRDRYCDVWNLDGFEQVIGVLPERKEEFRELVRFVGPRRRKNGPTGVFEGILKEPIYTPVTVDLNPTQRKMYDEIKTTLRTLDQAGEPIYSANVLALLNRLRQITVATPHKIDEYYDPIQERLIQKIELREPSSKLDALMDILDGMEWDEEYKQQAVVFSCFKDPIKLAKVRLDKAKIPYIHLDVKDTDRVRIDKWMNQFPRKEHQVFLCTLQLGGESIDLTSADTAIFLDRSWSPKDNQQARDRIYRPGQTAVPQIININARGTTDQRIERANEIKLGWFNEIFGDEEEDE